jgi:hypothetical protein
MYIAHFYVNNETDLDGCRKVLSLYSRTHVDEHIINSSNFLFDKLRAKGKTIIGTTDVEREPNKDEIVIVYGNYHHCVDNLPYKDKLYRHALYYSQIVHSRWEFDPSWNSIGKIYICNLEERQDRYMEILVELCRLGAPLDRIYHYKAKKEKVFGEYPLDAYIGATKNHLDVVTHFLNSSEEYCLVLEDDFTFTSSVEQHQGDLEAFFTRKYDFDVCLIGSSKYHEIKPYDDLLNLSFQECTTTSGYILSRQGAVKALKYFKEGYEKMKETKDYHKYVVDRYWRPIQDDKKFFIFKNKFGYQRCGYSSITHKCECHFD